MHYPPSLGCSRRDALYTLVCGALATTFSRSGSSPHSTQLPAEGLFPLGDFPLERGAMLPKAFIGYKTHGRLNDKRDNAILYPTQFAAQHADIEWLIGPGKALDPDHYFIVVLDQLGNGISSSPSNTPTPLDRMRFPAVTIGDDVTAQHRLVTEGFRVQRVALVTGYSMGAQQAYAWAVRYPALVDRIAPFCGTARTTAHNQVFLDGVRAALTADPAWLDGNYQTPPVRGLRALARVYAGWGFSQDFYNQGLYRQLGFATVEDVITGFWEPRYMRRDANNLLSMLRTWHLNDVSLYSPFNGDLGRALGTIRAKTAVLASQTDLYFRPLDVEAEAKLIPQARFGIIPSLWGHMAGAGINPVDSAFIDAELKTLLAS